jgi:hypothetical protein
MVFDLRYVLEFETRMYAILSNFNISVFKPKLYLVGKYLEIQGPGGQK